VLADAPGAAGAALDPTSLVERARALAAAGRCDDALAACELARDVPGGRAARSWALRLGAEVNLMLARPRTARAWSAVLRAQDPRSHVVDLLDGTALLGLGRAEDALELLEPLSRTWRSARRPVPAPLLGQCRGLESAARGDHHTAAAELLTVVRLRPSTPVWGPLARAAMRSAGAVTPTEVAGAIPDGHLATVLAQVALLDDRSAIVAVRSALHRARPALAASA
jgi:predicted Zn-dependent protease